MNIICLLFSIKYFMATCLTINGCRVSAKPVPPWHHPLTVAPSNRAAPSPTNYCITFLPWRILLLPAYPLRPFEQRVCEWIAREDSSSAPSQSAITKRLREVIQEQTKGTFESTSGKCGKVLMREWHEEKRRYSDIVENARTLRGNWTRNIPYSSCNLCIWPRNNYYKL